ncbi:M67 family metallopeptidase [Candidatus Poribacteria bacterium]|nr:M67 family metallopeptidase [Candidatus Poribacteria bacterium]
MEVPAQVWQAIVAHAERDYPEECCGVLLSAGGSMIVRECRNVQNALHAADPAAHPRDARTAYSVDPLELLEITREADRGGAAIAGFYHSHPDHEAYFSEEDRARAVIDGWDEPIYPDATYIVVSVRNGRAAGAQGFRWDDAARQHVECAIVEKS